LRLFSPSLGVPHMSWEQQYLELRLKNQISIHDTQVSPQVFVQGLAEIYKNLFLAVKEEQPGAKVKLADFAVEYLNIARSVHQAGPEYQAIKAKIMLDLNTVKGTL